MIKLFVALFSIIIIGQNIAHAKLFKNSFISFELPSLWDCELAKTTWNCSNKFEKNVKSAVIILAAKEAGPQDNLDKYIEQISQKPGVTIDGSKHFKAKKIKIQKTNINGQEWVDGLSYNSEAPVFYTRYLATVKNKIAILVTFTSHKDYYTSTVQDFIKAIASLKILSANDKSTVTPIEATKFKDTQTDDIEVVDDFGPEEVVESDDDFLAKLLTKQNLVLLAFAAVALFVILKL